MASNPSVDVRDRLASADGVRAAALGADRGRGRSDMSVERPLRRAPPPWVGTVPPPSRADAIGEPARRQVSARKMRVTIHPQAYASDMARLGLFPLPLVLVPTERVPLHIFEPRYRELIGECIERDEEFGVLLKKRGRRGARRSGRARRSSRCCGGCPTGGCTSRSRAASGSGCSSCTTTARSSRARSSRSRTRTIRPRARDVEQVLRALPAAAGDRRLDARAAGRGLAAARLPDRLARRLRQRREAGADRAHLAAAALRAPRRAARARARGAHARAGGDAVGGGERQGHAAAAIAGERLRTRRSPVAARGASPSGWRRRSARRAGGSGRCDSPRARSRASRRGAIAASLCGKTCSSSLRMPASRGPFVRGGEQGGADAAAPVLRGDREAEVGDVGARRMRVARQREPADDLAVDLGDEQRRVGVAADRADVPPLGGDAAPGSRR